MPEGLVLTELSLKLGIVQDIAMSGRNSLPPRLLTRAAAAEYCAISVTAFNAVCPVRPISLGRSKRMERFDSRSLDLWIDSLASNSCEQRRDWLTTWEAKQ